MNDEELWRETSTGEVCLECECEIVMAMTTDGLEVELSCECGSGLALCA